MALSSTVERKVSREVKSDSKLPIAVDSDSGSDDDGNDTPPPPPPSRAVAAGGDRDRGVLVAALESDLRNVASRYGRGGHDAPNLPAFGELCQAVQELYLGHIGRPIVFKLVPKDAFADYWHRAPVGHFVNDPSDVPDVEGYCISDLVWLTQACGEACLNTAKINREVCTTFNMGYVAEQLYGVDLGWPLPSMPGRPSVEFIAEFRYQVISTLVFMIPMGCKELSRIGFITGTPRSSSGDTKDPAASSSSSSLPSAPLADSDYDDLKDSPDDRKLTPMELSDRRATRKYTRELATLRDGVEAAREWLQKTATVFMHLDAVEYLFTRFPVMDIDTIDTSTRRAGELNLVEWLRSKFGWKPPSPYLAGQLDLACELALPLTKFAFYRRRSPRGQISYQELFRSAYYDSECDNMQKLSELPLLDLFGLKWESDATQEVKDTARNHRLLYLRDALILYAYHYYFNVKFGRSVNWINLHFISNSALRQKMNRLLWTDPVSAPMYHIVQIGAVYYVHNGKNLIRTPGIITALWYWTYCLRVVFKDVLPPKNHETATRWTDALNPAPIVVSSSSSSLSSLAR